MKIFLLIIFSVTLAVPATGQTGKEDSVRNIVCTIADADQLYRGNAIQDSIANARKRNDTILLNSFYSAFQTQDSINFATLKALILGYGYPTRRDNRDSCVAKLSVVLIHWSKECPDQFNSPEMVNIFKREVDNRHLSKFTLDMAIYFYVSYMPVNLNYFDLINNARTAYGLPPYTIDQYTGKARIDFDLNKLNADVSALTKQ